ncbi:hypothetical protein SAMN05444396_104305 [Flavobacterium segetis]|uniref:Disease resistance R13L4/SHOC-2-like LRR domain-containing protein n=1 Tax=Flavobacterium segetis TaxID=271157 RepID=A0A1M5H1I3_9FLAO|nr:hypothetical protein [Flavobacterium segetis]SHG09837.1 hypothetical protein SAMN05444396_104305 [Flavobacterium segetis]
MQTKLLLTILFLASNIIFAQTKTIRNKEFTNINEAMKKPEMVYILNLSNQDVNALEIEWSKFINIEYLNLRNDGLNIIPPAITKLKTLKIIDLSGNTFESLPSDFSNLTQLEEVFLNDRKDANLPKTLNILAKLPNLKSLHLENDGLKLIPDEILFFKKS